MRQTLLTATLVGMAMLFASAIQAQDATSKTTDPNLSRSDTKIDIEVVERPAYSKLQIDDLFEKLRIGMTCTDKANRIENYQFSEADLEFYLDEFDKITFSDKPKLPRAEARQRIQTLLDHTANTFRQIGVAEEVILHDYELLYSDDNRVFNVIRMEMDALMDGADHHLEMLIVDLDGNGKYRVLSAGGDH